MIPTIETNRWIGIMKVVCVLFILNVYSCWAGWFANLNEQVCYKHYGCFNDKSPYDNSHDVPLKPDEIGLELLLNNQGNPLLKDAEYLTPLDTTAIANSGFKRSQKVVMIIHGFSARVTNDWIKELGQAILAVDDVNLISVNWMNGSKRTYEQAVANTRLVGKMLSVFLRNVNKVLGILYSNMHLIGHSLGAHISGYVGEDISGLGRISGLDPAGYMFENEDNVVKLDKSDAVFVDVIHTDLDELIELGFGTEKALGHQDFYPNGGENQPGCSKNMTDYMEKLAKFKLGEMSKQLVCSHNRVRDLYISSITKCQFNGYRCSKYSKYLEGECYSTSAVMGYWADGSAPTGNYYLITTADDPYC